MNPKLAQDPEFQKRVSQLEKDYLSEKELHYVNRTYRLPEERKAFIFLGIIVGVVLAFALDYCFQLKDLDLRDVWFGRSLFFVGALFFARLAFKKTQNSGTAK